MSLIADIFQVLLVDDNNDVIATTTLTEANIDVSVSENEVRGGRGNALLGILHSDRDININLTDPEFRYDWLAKQLGKDIVVGTGVAYAMPKWYEVVDNAGSFEITLDKTPLTSDHGLKVFDKDGVELTATVSTNVVTLTGVAAGDKVEVRTYKYETTASAETIEIDNKTFAKGVKCILETLEIDGEENPTHMVQYQFDNSLPNGSFAINTSSERTAQSQSFALRVIKPKDSDVVGRVIREAI